MTACTRHSRAIRSAVIAIALSAMLGAHTACYDHSRIVPREPAASAATDPHATDRFARLVHRQLTDPDPVAIEQELLCESVRLEHTLGGREAELRIREVYDTAYRTAADSAALARVQAALAGHDLGTGGTSCAASDSAAAMREEIRRTTPSRTSIPPDPSHPLR